MVMTAFWVVKHLDAVEDISLVSSRPR